MLDFLTGSFDSWLSNSRPGDKCVYFSGNLGEARIIKIGDNDLISAKRALDFYYAGVVDLVQRKIYSGFDYIAVRRSKIAQVQDNRKNQYTQ